MVASSNPAQKVVDVAENWVGRSFRPRESAQCAPFLRHVFAEAGVPLANAANPTDAHLLYADDPLGPDFADSFAGDDVGRRVSLTSQPLQFTIRRVARLGRSPGDSHRRGGRGDRTPSLSE